MAVLSLDRVTKRFGDFVAVDQLSFTAPEGRIFGFLGPNGAGKTTSVRMVLDMLRPNSGAIEVLGRPPGRESLAEVGFLPEERGLYRRMTALDTVVYFGRLKGMTGAAARAASLRLLERFGLGPFARRRVDALSKGMAQKVQLATALVNAPRLVLLDEPFSGLDPVNQEVLEDLVRELAWNGATIVFSTHVMQHAERLCDRLLLMARGRKLFEGTQEEARRTMPRRLSLTARDDLRSLPGVAEASRGASCDGWTDWELTLRPGAKPGDLLEACFDRGATLRRFDVHRPSLHDVFVQMVGDDEAKIAPRAIQ
jgi:ABC-2 type transport system ATP-binding protein